AHAQGLGRRTHRPRREWQCVDLPAWRLCRKPRTPWSIARVWRAARMTNRDSRLPPFGSLSSDDDWADWDPERARRGYTGHLPALRDLDLPRDPIIDLPVPLPRPPTLAGAGALGPAGLAASARAATEDYLTVTYDLADPGFVELQDAVI